MAIFRGIFQKHQAKSEAGRSTRSTSEAFDVEHAPQPADTRPPVVVDQTLVALGRELEGLRHTSVPAAARERGWAALQRELELHPVQAAATKAPASGARNSRRARAANARRTRWALGGLAAAVAVLATVFATSGPTILQTATSEHPSTVTSVVSAEPTTDDTNSTSSSVSDSSSTSEDTQSGTTQQTVPTTTRPTDVTSGTTQATGHSTSTAGTSTTRPTSPPTTDEQQNAAAQLVSTARDAGLHLGQLAVTDNISGARGLVAAGAQSSLVQMLKSLNEPYGCRVVSAEPQAGSMFRVVLEIDDRVNNGNGELTEKVKKFVLKVRVNDDGALITDISAGS